MFSRRPKGATMHNQGNSGMASLLWMLFGAILTLGVGIFMYKSGVFDLGVHNQPQDEQKQVKTKIDLDKDNTNSEYEFYHVLHDQNSKNIPDTVVPDQPIDEDIEKQAKGLKPDEVVIATQEELDIANSAENSTMTQFEPAVSSNDEVAIEYENATYGDTNNADDKSSDNISAENISSDKVAKNSESSSDVIKSKETLKPKTIDDIETLTIHETRTIRSVGNDANNSIAIVQTASDTDKANKPSKSYILRINSFDSADEADKRREKVLMAGIDDAYVVKKTINNKTVYQVVSNAMSSKESVIQNQQRLKNSGIDSLVIEQRVK